MIYKLSDNIFSPLGDTSEENYANIKAGMKGGALRTGVFGLPEPFFGSLLDWNHVASRVAQELEPRERLTCFEQVMLLSAQRAVKAAAIDPKREDVVFVLSTTKGNVSLLEDYDGFEKKRANLWSSAQVLGNYFGNPNEVVVVSNACISGVAAQLLAFDLMRTKGYRHAVVVGADILCRFVVSGFQSFKALSPELCKPFDENRVGLNLGEAAATIVFEQVTDDMVLPKDTIVWRGGGNRNDANHISGPSRTGEGLFNATTLAMQNIAPSQISFICAHGTATRYNDDMESWAISRAGLSGVPTFSLKGYYGHTLGAAGLLECILSMKAIQDRCILPTAGFEQYGVVQPMTVCDQLTPSDKNCFLKLISGFGGSNAAIAYERV
ncbi:MAG: beta-ketoacyl synthase [Paludibacteraceae bacterium]|nr:beta-ketoacyl synthase [Paludibacteraceae bacterium]